MPARSDLEKSQQKLFRSLKHELDLIERDKSPEILAYERSFRASLPKSARASSKNQLIRAARSARVVLVGDFHPFRQPQKGFLRLLGDARRSEAIVGLECVSIRHQVSLDHFSAGHITTEELREEIDFDRQWPFSWASYREIFDYCRQERVRLLALNLPGKNADAGKLFARDEAAAGVLAKTARSRPKAGIFVLFGELHLAHPHLPARLKAAGLSTLVVHQNEASLYWKAPRTSRGQRAEVIRLRQNEYCVLNSVPWMKLQSYLDWLEGNEPHWEENLDLSGSVQTFSDRLAKILSLPPSADSALEVLGPSELREGARGLSREERRLLRHARALQRTTYLPLRRSLLLPTLSTNALTEAAALWLWGAKTKPKSAPDSGSRLVAQFFVGYLGSKILNPKRKCNEVADLKEFLARRGPVKKRVVVRRALSILEKYLKIGKFKAPALRGSPEIEASRLAGYVLANRVFHAWLKDEKLRPFIRTVFSTSNASSVWADRLLREALKRAGGKKIAPPRKNSSF